MDLGDIYQIKTEFDLGVDDVAVMLTYYRCKDENINSDAEDLYNAWNSQIGALLDELMTVEKEYSRVQVINGMDNDDFFEATPSVDGVRTGTSLGPAIACGIRSSRAGPGFRYSHHNMPLGAAGDFAAGTGRWSSGFVTEVDGLLDALRVDRTLGGGAIVEPVQITGGFVLGTPPTFKQVLGGLWSINQWPTYQRTRQKFDWTTT